MPEKTESPIEHRKSKSLAADGSAYWYFVYTTGTNPVKCHKITEEHPVDFAIRCSDKYSDGPYFIAFAMPISEERFKKHGHREA